MSHDLPRVLCVDDEPNVLAALERSLFDCFDVTTASSGMEGLEILKDAGNGEDAFAVIVSDMRMPEMDGAAFLAEARQVAPHSVRLLLTGQADTQAAISAINDGQIFRFLCKPCPQPQLVSALEAATRQYSLVLAEQKLLEDTLNGAVQVLTETLSLAAPLAFQRSSSLKRLVDHMTSGLQLESTWQYSIAAMLAPIGCVTLPTDVVERAYSGENLDESETKMIEHHPRAGQMLLEKIPRLENVAKMVGLQHKVPPAGTPEDVELGATMLRLALEVDEALNQGRTVEDVLRAGRENKSYPIRLLARLRSYKIEGGEVRSVTVRELREGMVLVDDIIAENGNILVARGRSVDEVMLQRLRNFSRRIGVREPFRARCLAPPSSHA